MSDQQPAAEETPPVVAAEPARAKWYKVLCWPTADRAGKPVVYIKAHASAGAATKDACERIDRKHGAGQSDGWTLTIQRTTKPKDAPSGGDQQPLADG